MDILLIEDDVSKVESISNRLNSIEFIDSGLLLDHADNLREARRLLLTKKYDLIIFDIYLPLDKGGLEQDFSKEIVIEFSNSLNAQTEAITITRVRIDDVGLTSLFNDSGITIVEYGDDDERWANALEAKLRKVSEKIRFDFLIFCALTKERAAFSESVAQVGALKNIYGMNCQEISIGRRKGLCIVPSRPGLVSMAIVAAKAIESFQPKVVAMSGICAGVEGECAPLDILVADICWEYQTGKYKNNGFYQEPYQSSISQTVRTGLAQRIEDSDFVGSLKSGLFDTELNRSVVRLVPISSGSAVIADSDMMARIGEQHRKMAGLEMEMYSLYEAADQAFCKPVVFGAKAVVDMGDASKGDSFHSTACVLSARFVAKFIAEFLDE
ncbi:phosphorylase family protein [Marinobacter nauticus]|uniref:phosphorylase family protein n=1 Tax=Marinobacter nauticus TaxID=2743 RepID=UPI004043C6C2